MQLTVIQALDELEQALTSASESVSLLKVVLSRENLVDFQNQLSQKEALRLIEMSKIRL